MLQKGIIVCCLGLFSTINASSQCPQNKDLWKRIVLLKENTSVYNDDQLKELFVIASTLEKGKAACINDSTYPFALQRIGVMYFKKGETERAIQYTQNAITFIRSHANLPAISESRLSNLYSNLIFYFENLNEPEKRIEAIDSSISIAVRLKVMDEKVVQSMEW